MKCEIRQYDPVKKCVRTRAAALLVYAVEDTIVGFSIQGEALCDSISNVVELLMFSVVSGQRGLGYGACILDNFLMCMSQQYFNTIVRCPGDNQLFFAMLMARGFTAIGRIYKDRILILGPSLDKGRSSSFIGTSR